MLKILNWNLYCMSAASPKVNYLRKTVEGHSFIVIMQEVKENAYEDIKSAFQGIAKIEFSLKYRIPGKFDTDSRKLGVAILVSNDIHIVSAGVLDRAIMPDRTLFVDVMYNHLNLRVMGLHSVTGCHHLKAKEIQYFSFAEAVDILKPDIIGIDANEPEVDHYQISKMKFFDNYNRGNGCKTFFETMSGAGLVDAYVKNYDCSSFVEGEYLATSHVLKRGKKRVRYDFLFLNESKFRRFNCFYDYDNAIASGSDHAAVIAEIVE